MNPDIWAMFGGRRNSDKSEVIGISLVRATQKNYARNRTTGMESWKRQRKSSALTAQMICTATAFIPWSCKIPMNEGYHEFI